MWRDVDNDPVSLDSDSRMRARNLLVEMDSIFLGFYASKSLEEFLSEAFTMFELCDEPSPFALMVGQLVTSFFGNNPVRIGS